MGRKTDGYLLHLGFLLISCRYLFMADLKIVEEISSKLEPSKNVLTKIKTAPRAKKFRGMRTIAMHALVNKNDLFN